MRALSVHLERQRPSPRRGCARRSTARLCSPGRIGHIRESPERTPDWERQPALAPPRQPCLAPPVSAGLMCLALHRRCRAQARRLGVGRAIQLTHSLCLVTDYTKRAPSDHQRRHRYAEPRGRGLSLDRVPSSRRTSGMPFRTPTATGTPGPKLCRSGEGLHPVSPYVTNVFARYQTKYRDLGSLRWAAKRR